MNLDFWHYCDYGGCPGWLDFLNDVHSDGWHNGEEYNGEWDYDCFSGCGIGDLCDLDYLSAYGGYDGGNNDD